MVHEDYMVIIKKTQNHMVQRYFLNNTGKEFLKLINKHFPPQHKLNRILNRNSIKINYSCMPNMKAIITGHNKKLLEKESSQQSKPCNCKNKDICPLSQTLFGNPKGPVELGNPNTCAETKLCLNFILFRLKK